MSQACTCLKQTACGKNWKHHTKEVNCFVILFTSAVSFCLRLIEFDIFVWTCVCVFHCVCVFFICTKCVHVCAWWGSKQEAGSNDLWLWVRPLSGRTKGEKHNEKTTGLFYVTKQCLQLIFNNVHTKTSERLLWHIALPCYKLKCQIRLKEKINSVSNCYCRGVLWTDFFLSFWGGVGGGTSTVLHAGYWPPINHKGSPQDMISTFISIYYTIDSTTNSTLNYYYILL